MVGISAVEGASRESICDSLGDQDSFGLCGASTSRANPPCSGDFVALPSLV